MESLLVTNSAVTLPVYRPLIGMDKNEVIEIARRIGTFDVSILPYEDCCTVFVAKHPVIKPSLQKHWSTKKFWILKILLIGRYRKLRLLSFNKSIKI